jgi:hypothetical protein
MLSKGEQPPQFPFVVGGVCEWFERKSPSKICLSIRLPNGDLLYVNSKRFWCTRDLGGKTEIYIAKG